MPGRRVKPKRPSTAEPDSVEGYIDAAVYQEDQGERYQCGDKAARHYREARRLFQQALNLQGDNTEAAYALGRICYTIATTFDAPPHCVASLHESVKAYRIAMAAEPSDEATFNLAQSLTTLGEMCQDGASREPKGAELAYWREAATLFSTTEAMQRDALADIKIGEPDAMRDDDADEEPISSAIVIETLVTLVDTLSSLYTAQSDPSQRDETWTSLTAALGRATELDSAEGELQHAMSGDIARVQCNATVARVEADYTMNAPPNASALLAAIEVLERLLGAHVGTEEKAPPLDALTDLADARATAADLFLRFAVLPSTSADDANSAKALGLEHLKAAYDLYDEILAALAAPLLRSTHRVPAHLIPSTLSATYAARSRLLLLLASASSSPTLLDGALDAAVRAVETCGAALVYRPAEKAFAKAPGTAEAARTDWTTVKALRDAAFCLVRAGFGDLGAAARLLKLSGTRPDEVRAYIEDDLRGDAVWTTSAGAEMGMWERVLAALEAEIEVELAQTRATAGR